MGYADTWKKKLFLASIIALKNIKWNHIHLKQNEKIEGGLSKYSYNATVRLSSYCFQRETKISWSL